jgi:hypothetical protein
MSNARNTLVLNWLGGFLSVAGAFHPAILAHSKWAKSANEVMNCCLVGFTQGF